MAKELANASGHTNEQDSRTLGRAATNGRCNGGEAGKTGRQARAARQGFQNSGSATTTDLAGKKAGFFQKQMLLQLAGNFGAV